VETHGRLAGFACEAGKEIWECAAGISALLSVHVFRGDIGRKTRNKHS
jgi:hypothetical protein